MNIRLALIIAGASLVLAGPVLADKPPHAGGGKKVEKEVGKGGPQGKGNDKVTKVVIVDRDRDIIRRYYGDQFRAGNCPPGLAKKNNGCMPPGQAKKWSLGRPLPRDVIWYDLPRDLYGRLSPVGDGYKYVRVGADILLLAVGTMMVVDALENLADL